MLNGVGQDLFTGIKENYGQEVAEAVVAMAVQHKEEVIKLVNLTMAELRVVLVGQRRDYGIDLLPSSEYGLPSSVSCPVTGSQHR